VTTTSAPPARVTTTTAALIARVTTTTESRRRTTTTLASVALAEPPSRPSSPPPTEVPRATPPPAAPQAVSAQDVEGLLQRYAAAWRRHDVDELRSIGQVNDDAQAAALRDYFARVQDLEVEVRIVETRGVGDRRVVRFTRLDRFRDPAGRVVAKETPPIEKDVVRVGSRLRFAAPQRDGNR
jgi:hypothetical protein